MTEQNQSVLEHRAALGAALVGGVFLLMGLVFAFRAVWSAGWVGPQLVVGGALAAGGLAIGFSELLWTRVRAAAAGLAGAGLGTLYLTLYIAYDWYAFIGGPLATALLLGVTGVGAALAIRRDSELMAALGLLGGILTPLLLARGGGSAGVYFAYVGLIDVAVIIAAVRRDWRWLAGLGVFATLTVRIGWGVTSFEPDQVTTAVLSSAALGGAFTLAACLGRTPRVIALLFTLGGLGSLLALIPFAALGHPPALWAAVAATSTLAALLQAASTVRRWPLVSGIATVLAGAALAVIGLHWPLDGAAGEVALVSLVALPPVTAWSGLAARRETPKGLLGFQVHALWLQAWLVGLTVAALSRDVSWLAAVSVIGAAVAWLSDIRLESRPLGGLRARLGPYAGVAPAIATVTGGLALVATGEQAPALALGAGGVVFALALLPPILGGEPGDRLRWAPLLAAPVALIPMVRALEPLGISGMNGVLPLVLAVPSFLLALMLHCGITPTGRDEVGRLAYAGLAVLFAASAVPLQLEREWLTIGWATQGLLLALASRKIRVPVVPAATLLLLGAVTVRLTLNPAVLSYHHVDHPTVWSWILYSYGLPTLALTLAAERLHTPESWRPEWLRGALFIAAATVAFAGLNLEVSHAFSQDGTLALGDTTLPGRLVRTLSWAVFGVTLLLPDRPSLRAAGVMLLGLVCLKVIGFDIWTLNGFARAGVLGGVAFVFLAAAGVLGRRTVVNA